MPVRIVAEGVLTRSVRDTAAFYREAETIWRNPRLAPIGNISRPVRQRLRVAMTTQGVGRGATPEVTALTHQTAELLESLGHQVEEIEPPVPESFADHFLLYWAMLAMVVSRAGRLKFGPSFDRGQLDNLTLGLARHCRRNLHRLPVAIAAIGATQRQAARHHEEYDVTLMPTLATQTPTVGHLDPTADFEHVLERLLDWVAFTPWQNATGEPAVSLPLATTAAGLPQGMMISSGRGREALLLGLAYELEEAAPFARIHG